MTVQTFVKIYLIKFQLTSFIKNLMSENVTTVNNI